MRKKKLQQKLSNCWKQDAEEQVARPVLEVPVQIDEMYDDTRHEEVVEHGSGRSTILQCEESVAIKLDGKEQNKKIQTMLPIMNTCANLDEEMSLWDDIQSERAFDEYREETGSVESMQSFDKPRVFPRVDKETQDLERTNDVHRDNACREASGVDQDVLPLSVENSSFYDDVAPIHDALPIDNL